MKLALRRPVEIAAWTTLSMGLGCGEPDGRPPGLLGVTSAPDSAATEEGSSSGAEATTSPASSESGEASASDSGDPSTGGGTGVLPIDCEADPQDPACVCAQVEDGEYALGPCAPACRDQLWRYALWVTSYNVKGTLGYGEHNGIGLIATRYSYDARFPAADGVAAPWRVGAGLWAVGAPISAAAQFRARTTAPGGEVYAPASLLPGDADDLFAGEEHPQIPVILPHPLVDAAALWSSTVASLIMAARSPRPSQITRGTASSGAAT